MTYLLIKIISLHYDIIKSLLPVPGPIWSLYLDIFAQLNFISFLSVFAEKSWFSSEIYVSCSRSEIDNHQ